MAALLLDEKSKDIQHNWEARARKRHSGSQAVSCNRRPDLRGDAEKRRIDDDADGNRDGRSYEQALVVVKVKLSRNMSFHDGLLCFVDYLGRKITIPRKEHQR
jgi:hypothetical protein